MTKSSAGAAAPSPASDADGSVDERYRFLAENIPVQIWTARPDGGLDYVSEQTARHFGMSPAGLLEAGWQAVVHADDLPRAIEKWIHSLGTGETYEVEFRLKRHDGVYACHLARAVARRDASGAIVQWFGTNTDIEEQRESQRRTQALLDEVAQQATEYAAVVMDLRRAKEASDARVAELERQLAARS